LIQPELRWWPHGTFRGYFFGLHAHYAFYNVGGLDHPPFSKYMNEHRFEGWLAGIGLSHGYRWNINHRWGLEASLGMGYAYLSYDRCLSLRCSEKSGSDTKHYITPTKAGITLIYSFGGKRKASEPFPAYPPKSNKHAIINESKSTVSDIVPKVETVKTRNETAKIYLAFVMGRSEIVSGFKNNADGLQRIQNLIHQLLDDPNATITGISIVGYASIEGNYIDNLTLSQQRAVALKDYIKSLYGIRDNHIFTIWGAGEDWATLEELVSRSNMSEKYRILDIIRNTDIFAGREKKLMDLAGGNPYRQMRDEMFPLLRRVECQIHYTVSNGIDATNHK